MVRDFLGNFVLESKPFLRDFGAKARHFVRAIRIGRKAFRTRSKTFAKKNGFEARDLSEKYERYANIWI